MPRPNRKDIFSPFISVVAHCVHRCVRQAYLLSSEGDPNCVRKNLVERLLDHLIQHFAIDCLSFAILDNHLHLILRNRPDIVRGWDDHTAAMHWLALFPGKCAGWEEHRKEKVAKNEDTWGFTPSDQDIQKLISDPKKLVEVRERLSDISWLMKALAETISKRINAMEGRTGKFWEGPFEMKLLLNDAAVLACAIYVDLNTIRAGMHTALDHAAFTTAIYRLAEAHQEAVNEGTTALDLELRANLKEISEKYGFVVPLQLKEGESLGSMPSTTKRRTSDKGFLPITAAKYTNLLQWTGEQRHPDKRGVITKPLEETLIALGISVEHWMKLAGEFDKCFFSLAGSKEGIEREQKARNLPSRKKCLGQKKELCKDVPAGPTAS